MISEAWAAKEGFHSVVTFSSLSSFACRPCVVASGPAYHSVGIAGSYCAPPLFRFGMGIWFATVLDCFLTGVGVERATAANLTDQRRVWSRS